MAAAAHDTYTNVRDAWQADEVAAWIAYLDARERAIEARSRKR